jgi:hypothetical protein
MKDSGLIVWFEKCKLCVWGSVGDGSAASLLAERAVEKTTVDGQTKVACWSVPIGLRKKEEFGGSGLV